MSRRIICWCALLFCAACSPAPKIKQTILTIVESPDSRRELLVVREDPGALGSSTAIFVRNKGEPELGDRVFTVKGEPKMEARWQSEGQAVIAHDAKKEDVFKNASASGSVTIEYASLKRADFGEAARNLGPP